MRNRKQITLHLDIQIAQALEIEAARRGLNASRAANDILRRVLVDEGDIRSGIGDNVVNRPEGRFRCVKRRLGRVLVGYVHQDRDGASASRLDLLLQRFEQRRAPSPDDAPVTMTVRPVRSK